jgi:hypothetical protein
MLDINGAMMSSARLYMNKTLLSMGIKPQTSAIKASLNMQIAGTYALLFPVIHRNYPTKQEVEMFVYRQISLGFLNHHLMNLHSQPQYSTGTGFTNVMQGTIIPIILETFLTKLTRKIPIPSTDILSADDFSGEDLETGSPQTETVPALSTSQALPYLV